LNIHQQRRADEGTGKDQHAEKNGAQPHFESFPPTADCKRRRSGA
jgi:hypothetical protein